MYIYVPIWFKGRVLETIVLFFFQTMWNIFEENMNFFSQFRALPNKTFMKFFTAFRVFWTWNKEDREKLLRRFSLLWSKSTIWLTHLFSMLPFYTPWHHQKTLRFSDVFRGYWNAALEEMCFYGHLFFFQNQS